MKQPAALRERLCGAKPSQVMESAQSRYEESAALARVGQASRLDELSAWVDMENQRPQARSAETLYANALDSFKAVLGIEREAGLSLQGSLEYSGAVVASEDSRGSSLETAALWQGIEALEAQRKAAWHEAYIPSLRFSWNANPPNLSIPRRISSGTTGFSDVAAAAPPSVGEPNPGFFNNKAAGAPPCQIKKIKRIITHYY